MSGNPWNSGLLLHGPTERWDNVDYWDFPRHVRPLAFPPCSLFAYTWKTLEASSDFYLDCLPDVEGLNRRHDLSIIIHCRHPTGTIPPPFFLHGGFLSCSSVCWYFGVWLLWKMLLQAGKFLVKFLTPSSDIWLYKFFFPGTIVQDRVVVEFNFSYFLYRKEMRIVCMYSTRYYMCFLCYLCVCVCCQIQAGTCGNGSRSIPMDTNPIDMKNWILFLTKIKKEERTIHWTRQLNETFFRFFLFPFIYWLVVYG